MVEGKSMAWPTLSIRETARLCSTGDTVNLAGFSGCRLVTGDDQ
jgi:hypothetical protein